MPFQSLEGIFGFFNEKIMARGGYRPVSIPRRDFWVFQLVVLSFVIVLR
ncbi:hypothetical protein CKA32_000681 [Geitlerinema sp. FC II]|nr:hypothetical protein CKA32_000681 [Geitlerinema sp. FC II]